MSKTARRWAQTARSRFVALVAFPTAKRCPLRQMLQRPAILPWPSILPSV